jgi:zinc protease
MLKKYPLLLLLAISGLLTKAQDERKLADNIFWKQLPNGLEVLIVEDHTVPLVTLNITFRAGGINQTKADNGLIALYGEMMLRGDKDYPSAQDFSYRAGALGTTGSNRITSEENTTYYFTLTKKNFEDGLKYMNGAVRFPVLDPSDLIKEKALIDNQIKQKSTRPTYALATEMDRQLWGDQESRKTAQGDSDVINAATIERIYAIKSKYFNPDNALLVVGGDIDHEDAFKQVEAVFGDWQTPAGNDQGQWIAPEFKPLEKPSYFIVSSALAQAPLIEIYWHGPDTRNDVAATYAADVFSYILNQNSSRLRTALIQSGLAASVSISYLTLKHTGPISIFVAPNPSKLKECMEEVNRQVALMDDDDYITDQEIATAKRILEITDVRREDITSDFVHTLSFWWSSATLDYYFSYLDNLKKVSRADLKRYVDKYLKNQPYCEGLLIDPGLRAEIKADDFFKPGKY